MFIDDILDDSLEKIERIRQKLRELRRRKTENATVCGKQVHGTTGDLKIHTKQVANTTGRRATTIKNPDESPTKKMTKRS